MCLTCHLLTQDSSLPRLFSLSLAHAVQVVACVARTHLESANFLSLSQNRLDAETNSELPTMIL